MADRTIRVTMTHDIIVSRCINCGVIYGVTDDFEAERLKDGRTFYCPNGHMMTYRETEHDRIRQERDRLKQQMARVEDERREAERREDIAKQELARVNKRIHNGMCPCCNRSFVNLARHMKTKHPEIVTLRGKATA